MRAVCDVCVAHCDRAAVSIDVDAQSSTTLAKMSPTFPLMTE